MVAGTIFAMPFVGVTMARVKANLRVRVFAELARREEP